MLCTRCSLIARPEMEEERLRAKAEEPSNCALKGLSSHFGDRCFIRFFNNLFSDALNGLQR